MTDQKIDSVVAELRREEECLKKELAELKAKEHEVLTELERIRAGISGLVGKGRARKSSAGSGGKASTSSPRYIVEAAEEILRNEGSLSGERLEERVSETLQASGRSTSRLHAQLEKALQDERFVSSVSGWKLGEHIVKASPQLEP